MYCYKCNALLSEKGYCTSCGADVVVYKKIVGLSNLYYNDGLEKAKVRDLSSAIVSLKRSLKFYKKNISARNLLGLIYYEMGETVSALGQWIISMNIQQDKNIAKDYMKILSSNQAKLDSINQTIRKFNVCLEYCSQDSDDLAVIQLKKLLSDNPHLLQGHQLLALIYIKNQEFEKAYKQLQSALNIDRTNTTTLHLINEITDGNVAHVTKTALKSDEGRKIIKKSKDKVEYHSGNEMIIQPTNIKENNGVWTIINIVIGLIVGAAVTYFLIVPTHSQLVKNKYKVKENESYEELQEKKAEIDSLNNQIAQLRQEIDSSNSRLAGYEGDSGIITGLVNFIEAEKKIVAGDVAAAFESLVAINRDTLPDAVKATWQELYNTCLPQIMSAAEREYKSKNNADLAIKYYQQVLSVDGANEDAVYHCAEAMKKKGSKDEAVQMYNNYLQQFPSGRYVNQVNNSLNQLQK